MPDSDVVRGLAKQLYGQLQHAFGRATCNQAVMNIGNFNSYVGQHQEAEGRFRDIARSATTVPRSATDISVNDSPPTPLWTERD